MNSVDLKNVLAAIKFSKKIELEGEALLLLSQSLNKVFAFVSELEQKEKAPKELEEDHDANQ